jgi:hypothetical protein
LSRSKSATKRSRSPMRSRLRQLHRINYRDLLYSPTVKRKKGIIE